MISKSVCHQIFYSLPQLFDATPKHFLGNGEILDLKVFDFNQVLKALGVVTLFMLAAIYEGDSAALFPGQRSS